MTADTFGAVSKETSGLLSFHRLLGLTRLSPAAFGMTCACAPKLPSLLTARKERTPTVESTLISAQTSWTPVFPVASLQAAVHTIQMLPSSGWMRLLRLSTTLAEFLPVQWNGHNAPLDAFAIWTAKSSAPSAALRN